MPHKLEWEKDGVYWKYSGDVSGKEVIAACASIYGDSRFDALNYKMVDFTDASSISMTDDDLMKIAFQDKAAELTNPHIKSAIIMTLETHLGEKFASYFADSGWEVEVFQDIVAATNWLGRETA